MSSDELEIFHIRKLIEELKNKRGRGTELISLYIPVGRPIADIMNILRQEYSTASNIKDRVTRHHVLDALTSVMQRLKLFKQTPKNGLIIFCGYVTRGAPGDEEMEVHVLEPPQRLTVYLYRCDSRFHIEILEDMIAEKESYGFIVIDRSEAAFAVLHGRSLEFLKRITSGVPGKHRAGGQSSRRFARVIEQLAHEFYKRAGEYANKYFLNMPDLKGIIIGGPGPTKLDFYEGEYLHYELKKRVLAVLDVGYSGEEGIYELVKKSNDVLKDIKYFRERNVFNEFMKYLVEDTGLATYGENEVREALALGAVDKLLISEKVDKIRVKAKCNDCGYVFKKSMDKNSLNNITCPKCGSSNVTIIEQKLLIDELAELAKKSGSEIFLLSTNTEEGEALRKTFGGIAAILRFKIDQLS